MNYLCTMHYSTNRLREFKNGMHRKLEKLYPREEAMSIVNRLIFHFLGLTRVQQQLAGDVRLSESEMLLFHNAMKRLLNGEPVQYVLGTTEFYGLRLEVGPGVLIPRPETEQLVERVLLEHPEPNNRVLDIGTGSGCIALALKSRRKHWEITAVDVSSQALVLARRNSDRTALPVDFKRCDILSPSECYDKTGRPSFHIMVSNPPYVLKAERKHMAPNVLKFEPEIALFVDDRDPLLFYRKIANYALQALVPGGMLYFEVNERFALETESLLREKSFSGVGVFTDFRGKPRMVRAKKP